MNVKKTKSSKKIILKITMSMTETYFGNARIEGSRRSQEWCHIA